MCGVIPWEEPDRDIEDMGKYKVTLKLMVDPTESDETFNVIYKVDAISEFDAYRQAGKMQDVDVEEIRYRTVFDYKVKKLKD